MYDHTKNEVALDSSKQGRKPKKIRAEVVSIKRKAVSVAVAMCFASQYVSANPTGANVVRGSASISSSGSTMSIANTPGAIIHWDNFSINAGETTVFNQVNAASSVLNRVTGGNISQILGTLRSNGQVYLINPSGIVFGANAVVDVAGLVASTLNIKDADFIAGKKLFNADTASAGSVINHGQITTPSGGFVYLLAPQVENNGIITTPSGEAILAAGNSVEIVDSVNPMQRVRVSAQSQDVNLSALMTQSNGNIFSVLNRGTVSANTVHQDATGRIFFKSAGSIQTTASSVVEAKGDVLNNGGTFIGFADTAGFYAGRFDASGKNGGFIETSGRYLDVTGIDISARALAKGGKAGDWLLDPYNITIATGDNNISAGPTFTPTGAGSTINVATILAALNAGTNVTVDTANAGGTEAGNINILADINMTGASNASLTFNADGQITMATGTAITDTGTGNLSVTMLADRDNNGDGGFVLNRIDVGGSVSLTSNSGDLSFVDNPTGSLVRGSSVGVTLVNGNVSLVGGLNGSQSIVATTGDVVMNINGNVTLTGGLNPSAFVRIAANNGDVRMQFLGTGNTLELSGINSSAQIIAGGDVQISGDTNAHNPLLSITGGGSGGANAGIAGNSISNLAVSGINMQAGAGGDAFIATTNTTGISAININAGSMTLTGAAGTKAEIGSQTGNVNVQINADSLTLLGTAVGSVAGIGAAGASNNAIVNINASTNGVRIEGNGARVGSLQGNAQITITGTATDANQPNGISIGNGASVGSQLGAGSIELNGTTSAINGAGVAIANTTLSNGSGTIRIQGTALPNSGSRGVSLDGEAFMSSTTGDIVIRGTGDGGVSNVSGVYVGTASVSSGSGNIDITGIGSSSSTNAAGVLLDNFSGISTGGNINITGTGRSGAGASAGVAMTGTTSPPSVSSGNGNINIEASSMVPDAVNFQTGSIAAGNGRVSITALNNNMNLGNAEISAGTAVNLNALAGNITQTSAGSIVTPRLNARALNINLGSLLNNFNSGLFATNNLFTLTNSASGTIDYEFSQASTVYELEQNNATTLNITALNGLTFDGSMNISSVSGSGSPIDNVNVTASDLRLTNAADISVGNNLRVVAQSLTIDGSSSVSVGNNANIAAESITMDNASISAGNDVNVLTRNLRMTASEIVADNNVNINSVPLAFKLGADGSNLAQIQNIFNRITQGVQIGLRQGSTIFAANNTNVAGADIKLSGSEIGSGNITTVFSRNNIELTGGTNEARIFAQNEVLLVAGKQVMLNDGESAAIVETDSPNTIFLSFPQLPSDGFVVNGVANAITNGRSGFFTGGIGNRTPAVLGTNIFVTYNDTSGLLRSLLNRNFNDVDLLVTDERDSDAKEDNKNANSARECS